MKLALDAGHGYNTAGKRTPDGIREWSLNETVLRGFNDEIIKYGVKTVRLDDPTGKTDVGLIQRTNTSKANGCDMLISFHHNAYKSVWGDHGGTETYIARDNTANRRLSNVLQNEVLKSLGLRNRGVKVNDYFHIIREAGVPAVLVELGFMDSNTDKILRDDITRYNTGVRMAKAFANEYGLTATGNPTPNPTPKPNPIAPNATKYERPAGTYAEIGRFTNLNDDKLPIHMRQYVPNVAGVFNGKLGYGEYVDYQDVYWGNGYVWVGNGTTWIPTAILGSNGKAVENWGTWTSRGSTPKPTGKTIEQMAREVINGDHGTGHANRQKSLGVDNDTYAKVRARVNQLV